MNTEDDREMRWVKESSRMFPLVKKPSYLVSVIENHKGTQHRDI